MRNNIKIIKRLLKLLYPNNYLSSDFVQLSKIYIHLIKYHNIHGAIKYMKNMRLICTRYICGNPMLNNNFAIGTTDGWPNKLIFLKSRIDDNQFSYVLSLLLFNRSLNLNKVIYKKLIKNLDLSSITSPPKSKYTIPSSFIIEFVKKYNLKLKDSDFEFSLKDVYLSMKGGPQGVASNYALDNFKFYTYNLMDNILKLTNEDGRNWFLKSYSYWFNNSKEFNKEKKSSSLGKLSIIKDPEGKLRIIAIVDYYTQLFLRKLHNALFKVIKNFKDCDRTFDQSPFKEWEDNNHKFWSLDLSSATDRFPRQLQMNLLTHMYNIEYARAWCNHLGQINFSSPNGGSVSYKTGQPMGTYSSWICFTLAHHLVIHWCAKLENISNFTQYIILGDDIVIKHDKVAERYIDVITKLGVDISLTKTHVSVDTYEFAKRWIKNSKEISGVPTKGIIENFKNPLIVFNILYEFFKIKNNIYKSKYDLLGIIRNLYKNLYLIENKKKIFINYNYKSYLRLLDFRTLLDWNFGHINDQSLRLLFTRNITNELYSIPNGEDILLEYKKILSTGLGRVLSQNVGNVSAYQFKIIDNYKIEDKNLLIYYPTFVGLCNYISALKEKTKKWNINDELSDYVSDLITLKVENIFNKERNKLSTLLSLNSSMRIGFSELNKTQEIMYGSATVESSLSPKGMQLWFSKSITNDVLKQIMLQTWEKPKPQMSYEDMWNSMANK